MNLKASPNPSNPQTTIQFAPPASSRVTLDIYDLQLRVTRPSFIQGIRVLAESDAPVPHLQSVER